ncbi:MAG: hypothetical protein JSR54_15210, partial [Proteobacteria bacterium]|nr:hypothetical protein [Pseudomonadota bacterium]
MPRPHTDFLQAQTIPWQPCPWPHLAGCQMKLLSRDPAGGATSLLVRFPAGWNYTDPGCLGTSGEFFVVDGELELAGRAYGQDCYGHFPAGFRHTSRCAPQGAVALLFYGAEPAWTPLPAAPAAADRRTATLIDAFEQPWLDTGLDPAFGGRGHRIKLLHGSLESGHATLLVSSPPHLHPANWRAPQEIHPCDEELFLLSGDFVCGTGQMSPGAYCWRPAGIPHGPYASRGGNLA